MSDQAPQAKPPRRRRLGRIVVVGIPFLFAAALLGVHAYNVTGLNRYEAARQRARAGGLPLTYEEIEAARPVWPNEANGARIIETLASQLTQLQSDKEFCKLPIISQEENPPLGRLWFPRQQDTINAQLPKVAHLLVELDQLARYAGGRFKLTLDGSQGPPLPVTSHWAWLRFSARLKSLQMIDHAIRGEREPIITDFTVLAVLPQLLDSEPTSVLFATYLEELAIEALERACSVTSFDASELQGLDGVLARMERLDRLYWHVLGERAYTVVMFDWVIARDPVPEPELSAAGIKQFMWDLVGKGLVGRIGAEGLRLADPFSRAAHDRRQFLQACHELPQKLDRLPSHYSLAGIGVSAMDMAIRLDTRAVRRIRFARTALAVERYRLDHGSFPRSLDALVPDYLPELLTDPFDGSPLRYRIEQGCAIIDTSSPERFQDRDEASAESEEEEKRKPPCFRLLPPEQRGLPPEEPFPPPPASEPEAGGPTAKNATEW